MLYPGDIKTLVLSIINPSGGASTVTVAPVVSIVKLSTGTTVLSSAAMTLLAGTETVYYYAWSTTGMAVGDYVAIVSYAANSVTVNGQFLTTFHLGDTNITGPVALQSLVALNATVAKDATVAHVSDLATVNPDNSVSVQAILAKTNNLPTDPASNTVVNEVGANVQALYNYEFGTWTIDKTQNPQVLTILAPGGATLASFTLTDSSTQTQRAPQS